MSEAGRSRNLFSGKMAVVTGAAVTRSLGLAGATVIVADLRPDAGEAITAQLNTAPANTTWSVGPFSAGSM